LLENLLFKKMTKILLYFLFLIPLTDLTSQSFYSIEIGGGYTDNVFRNNELEYWDKGFIILFNNDFQLNTNFSLTQTLSYQNINFNNSLYSLGITVPAIYGVKIGETVGENSKFYEVSIGIRTETELYSFKTISSLRVGVFYIDEGLINTSVEIIDGYGNIFNTNYQAGGDQFFRGFVSLGLGGLFSLSQNMNLVLEGKLATTVYDLILNTAITSQLQFLF